MQRVETFRDPAGSLAVLENAALRRVAAAARAPVLEFLADPAAVQAVADGRLIASEVVPDFAGTGELELMHPLVEFPSYCWEWTPSMWLQAAELTLDLGVELLRQGWMLKDATPHNVLFRGGNPVFVDVLSFERWDGRSVWPAYGQFVRTFLLPMLAYVRLGWPLGASLLRRDGLEPEEVYAALGWVGRVRPSGLRAVTLPRLLGRFAAGRTDLRSVPQRLKPRHEGISYGTGEPVPLSKAASLDIRGKGKTVPLSRAASLGTWDSGEPAPLGKADSVGAEVVQATMRGLRRQMRGVVPVGRRSKWSDYAETASHYGGEDHAGKQAFVERVMQAERPGWVLDVGANTGTYAMIAALAGAEVVAIDADVQAVDRLAREAAESGGAAARIQALCVDLAQPTPAAGWQNRESLSFLDRADGRFDMVMMLAVVHHLLLTSQIPLQEIAAMCARLTTRGLIVEWVPGSDPRFQELVRGRDALYAGLTEEAFRAAMDSLFETRGEKRLGNGRVLLHMRRRGFVVDPLTPPQPAKSARREPRIA